MKNVFYSGKRMLVRQAISSVLLISTLIASNAVAQTTYLSIFPNAIQNDNYFVNSPSCLVSVNAPTISNAQAVSSGTLTDYATLSSPGIINLTTLCSNDFSLRAKINTGGPASVPASVTVPYYAGFRIRVSTTAQIGLLSGSGGSNFVIRTYQDGVPVETVSGVPLGISLLQANVPGNVYFQVTKPFNQVGIDMTVGVLTTGIASNVDFYYAYASTVPVPIILPVKLSSFTASTDAKGVKLAWTSATESNLAAYELERSSNGGVSFEKIATVAGKGSNSSEANYNYLDASVVNGDYSYRLKMTDKDGKVEYSKVITAKIVSATRWKIYPTLLSSGTNLNISFATGSTAKVQVQITNLQGQVLQSVNTTESKLIIPTNRLSTGVYLLKLFSNGQLQTSEKIIIQ